MAEWHPNDPYNPAGPPYYTRALIDRALRTIRTYGDQLNPVTRSINYLLGKLVGDTREISRRVRLIEEDQNLDEEAIQITRDELAEIQARVPTLEERIATLEQRTLAAEARATAAEQRAEESNRALREMTEYMTRHFGK